MSGLNKLEDNFVNEISNIIYPESKKEIDWNEIDRIVNIGDIELYSPWNGYSGDFWDSPMHHAIDNDDIELVKGIIKHGNGLLGDTEHYRWHVEDLGCDWTYKEYIIANMKLDMMKALDIHTTREQMIETRQCIFNEAPDKTYMEFMNKVMDWQYNSTMAELNKLIPGPINKRNLNFNKTMKNIENILHPPKLSAKKALRKNKKGGKKTRKRRV